MSTNTLGYTPPLKLALQFLVLRRHHSDPNDWDDSDDEVNPEPDDDVPEDGVNTSIMDDNMSEHDDGMAVNEVDDSGYSSEQPQDAESYDDSDPRLDPETDPDPISKAQVSIGTHLISV